MQLDIDKVPLIRWIPPGRRQDSVVVRRYRAGERIFEQGDPTTGLWIVLEGRVAVERVGADGTLTTTGVWVARDIVGIAGLWDRSGYPASARALESPTVMGWMARDEVMRLHEEVPQFGLEISRLLSERLRFVQEAVSGRQGRPIINQVASVRVRSANFELLNEVYLHGLPGGPCFLPACIAAAIPPSCSTTSRRAIPALTATMAG